MHTPKKDRKQIAVCPNTEDVLIYSNCEQPDFTKWKLEHTLKGHDLVVSAIDWSPIHNKIVTCSHDRNAFVWTYANGEWKPSLSILRINRAALCVKWSPDGKKFAVASGAKVVPVCHYEQQNDWWISKMVKKHKSTVLWVSWHPNSQLLATTSSDFRCRVFSAFIPDVDGKSGCNSILCGDTSKTAFGDMLAEYDGSNGWVESCAWSPNGFCLAYVGHDSSVNFVNFDEKKPTAEPVFTTFKEKFLPATVCIFLNDQTFVTAGHDFKPSIYQHPGAMRGNWKLLGSLDKAPPKKEAKATPALGPGDMQSTRALWANKVTKGQESSNNDSATLWTKHTNTIVDIKPYGDVLYAKLDSFSTCGLDGNVVVWVGKEFKSNVDGLTL